MSDRPVPETGKKGLPSGLVKRTVRVELADASGFGPLFQSVEVVMAVTPEWSDEMLRESAAEMVNSSYGFLIRQLVTEASVIQGGVA